MKINTKAYSWVIFLFAIVILPRDIFAQIGNMHTFADTLKYGWFTPEDRYDFRDNLALRNSIIPEYERSMISVSKNMERSWILPGSGHFHTQNYMRGLLFLGSEIFIASTVLYLFDKGASDYNSYKEATQIDEINKYYDSAVDSYLQATLLSCLFVAVWVFNVYDTHQVTTEYNKRMWNDHLNREKERRLHLTPTGVTYRF